MFIFISKIGPEAGPYVCKFGITVTRWSGWLGHLTGLIATTTLCLEVCVEGEMCGLFGLSQFIYWGHC